MVPTRTLKRWHRAMRTAGTVNQTPRASNSRTERVIKEYCRGPAVCSFRLLLLVLARKRLNYTRRNADMRGVNRALKKTVWRFGYFDIGA